MKRRVWCLFTLPLVALGLIVSADAQEKKQGNSEARVSGTVRMINKDTSTITVRERRTNAERQVVYSSDTKFTLDNKPGSVDAVKDGVRVICLGKYEGTKLMATRVDVRK